MKPCSLDEHWEVLALEHHIRGRRAPWLDVVWYRTMLRWLRWRIRCALPAEVRMIPTVPDSLGELDQWILWSAEFVEGKSEAQKIPYSPRTQRRASTINPRDWSSFSHCASVWRLSLGIFRPGLRVQPR